MIKAQKVLLRSLAGAAAVVAGVLAGAPAGAQDGNTIIGVPQLRDFQLEPKQRLVTQPRPQPAQTAPNPAQAAAQPGQRPASAASPTATRNQPEQQRPAPAARAPAGASQDIAPRTAAPGAAPAAGAAAAPPLANAFDAAPAAALPTVEPAALPAPPVPLSGAGTTLSEGPPLWVFFLAFVTVGLLGYGYWLRRQAMERRALAMPVPAVAPPRAPAAPRPAPVPRPWLEISLKPERATIDLDRSVIEFELTVRNSGGSPARDVKLQARLFCSTPKQDQELAAYFKSRPGDYKTIALPDLPAGRDLVINGSVDMDRDRINALRVEDKLLLVPLIGVNAFYSWGSSRSGQTSKSFVVGREQSGANDKMAPFRLDMGARVYRTIGQRAHPVSRRV